MAVPTKSAQVVMKKQRKEKDAMKNNNARIATMLHLPELMHENSEKTLKACIAQHKDHCIRVRMEKFFPDTDTNTTELGCIHIRLQPYKLLQKCLNLFQCSC